MRSSPGVPETVLETMKRVLQSPELDCVGFCDRKRRAWTLNRKGFAEDPFGGLWQALNDCYTVLSLQRLPCRELTWVLDTGQVAGVHSEKVGTLGLVTRGQISAEDLNQHLEEFRRALAGASV